MSELAPAQGVERLRGMIEPSNDERSQLPETTWNYLNDLESELDAKDKQIAELEKDRARLERGLRNCLLFASKMSNNKKPWARSIRGFCADAGVTPNPLRTATLAQQGDTCTEAKERGDE